MATRTAQQLRDGEACDAAAYNHCVGLNRVHGLAHTRLTIERWQT